MNDKLAPGGWSNLEKVCKPQRSHLTCNTQGWDCCSAQPCRPAGQRYPQAFVWNMRRRSKQKDQSSLAALMGCSFHTRSRCSCLWRKREAQPIGDTAGLAWKEQVHAKPGNDGGWLGTGSGTYCPWVKIWGFRKLFVEIFLSLASQGLKFFHGEKAFIVHTELKVSDANDSWSSCELEWSWASLR